MGAELMSGRHMGGSSRRTCISDDASPIFECFLLRWSPGLLHQCLLKDGEAACISIG